MVETRVGQRSDISIQVLSYTGRTDGRKSDRRTHVKIGYTQEAVIISQAHGVYAW